MTEYIATTPGVFPLPDWAKSSLSDLKGHQKHDLIRGDESDDIESVYADARQEVIERQTTAGLDLIVEGQLRWDDMLAHPLCVHENVETRGLVRYYDNNNFYRDPVVTGELTPSGDVARELDAALTHTDALQTVLPGPYSLFDLATDEHYGSDTAFLAAIGAFLAGELERCPVTNAVFLLEPSLATNPPDDDLRSALGDALETVTAHTESDVIVHPYWGALDEKTYTTMLESPVDGVGFDLVSSADDQAALIAEHGTPASVALGVVDGQNTRVESRTEITEHIEWFESHHPDPAGLDRVYVTTNTELFYLPVSKFADKLAVLGQATRSEVVA